MQAKKKYNKTYNGEEEEKKEEDTFNTEAAQRKALVWSDEKSRQVKCF